MMALGGAEHARIRRLVSSAFTPRAIEQLRPDVERLGAELVAGLVARGEGDIVTELAFPLPMQVVRLLFGVDDDGVGPRGRGAVRSRPRRSRECGSSAQMGRLADYFWAVVARRRAGPGRRRVLHAPPGRRRRRHPHRSRARRQRGPVRDCGLRDDDGPDQPSGARAARPTRTSSHSCATTRRSRATPSTRCLRFEPPAISSTRSTPVDIEIDGVTIPAGSNILVSVLAGNRDPRRYERPRRVRDHTRRHPPVDLRRGSARVHRRRARTDGSGGRAGRARGADRRRSSSSPIRSAGRPRTRRFAVRRSWWCGRRREPLLAHAQQRSPRRGSRGSPRATRPSACATSARRAIFTPTNTRIAPSACDR